jgi:cytoskeletal protein CcmA (bactofilin family)
MAKEENPPISPAPDRPPHPASTRFGSTLEFKGDLEGHEDIVLEGRFKGKITLPSGVLTVARSAKVEADVAVRSLVLNGELSGTVRAAERVLVSETGRMTGDVTTPRISVSNGAQFKGSIKIEKA